MFSRVGEQRLEWQFEEHHSAAGWIDEFYLLIASETGLWTFNTKSGDRQKVCDLEADDASTRSNDGRADPFGGFWIGTMGKNMERGKGSIYRYFQGRVHKLYDQITVSNSICFAPDKTCAFFCDTFRRRIMRQPLDELGFPVGTPEVFVDLRPDESNPDGSIIDETGALWNAHWGKGRVVRYLPDGTQDLVVSVPGILASCPALGGETLQTLFVTTARESLEEPDDHQGQVYALELGAGFRGLPEYQVTV